MIKNVEKNNRKSDLKKLKRNALTQKTTKPLNFIICKFHILMLKYYHKSSPTKSFPFKSN